MPATQIRQGMIILMDGELYKILVKEHVTPGKGRGMVQTKLRRLSTGTMHDVRFRSSDIVERAVLDTREMQYLYDDATGYHFMDTDNYEQIILNKDDLGETVHFLIPDLKVKVEMFDGKPVGVEPPITVDLKVVQTDPKLKGATVSNQNKPATLETGFTVNVPPFIEEGEMIRVDTRTGNYVERVK